MVAISRVASSPLLIRLFILMARTTLTDVAKALGLSTTTVSRALAGYPDVSEATRERVRATAQAMGYVPNRQAQLLRRKRAGAVGIVLPPPSATRGDMLLSEWLVRVSAVLQAYELDFVVASAATQDSERAIYRRLVSGKHVDGFLVPYPRVHDWRLDFLKREEVAVVAFGRSQPEVHIPFVSLDDKKAMILLVKHLARLGHTQIGFIGASEELLIQRDRWSGFKEGIFQCGLELNFNFVQEGDMSCAGGYFAAESLLALQHPPTAIVCINDATALGAMRAVRQKGLRPGKDIAITGFDDLSLASYAYPPLTTIHQPLDEIARRQVGMLLQRFERRSEIQASWMLQPTLIIRQSCGCDVPMRQLASGVHVVTASPRHLSSTVEEFEQA